MHSLTVAAAAVNYGCRDCFYRCEKEKGIN